MRNQPIEHPDLTLRGVRSMLDLALLPSDDKTVSLIKAHPWIQALLATLSQMGIVVGMGMEAIKICLLSKMARDVLQVQNACNLIAVVGSYHEVLKTLRWIDQRRPLGMPIESHPISILWADKISSLVKLEQEHSLRMIQAYDEVERLAAIDINRPDAFRGDCQTPASSQQGADVEGGDAARSAATTVIATSSDHRSS